MESQEVIDKNDLVTLRMGTKDDLNFILATWLRGLYYGDSWFSLIDKKVFMENYHKFLDKILSSPNTLVCVACLKEDPDTILGYSVLGDKYNLHWVFVKKAWRNIGIAKSLVPPTTKYVTHLTKVGTAILKNSPNLSFNPFVV